MGEWLGVAIALASSSLGGTAAAVTRYLVGGADPILLAILRWGIGFLCLLPCALLLGVRWPQRSDWPAVALLGICFFGLFFILYAVFRIIGEIFREPDPHWSVGIFSAGQFLSLFMPLLGVAFIVWGFQKRRYEAAFTEPTPAPAL